MQTLLSPGGRFYLVTVAQNKPDEINARMRAAGLECKTIIKRRAGRELLSVLRMIRPASAYSSSLASAPRSSRLTPVSQHVPLPADKITPARSDNDSEYGGLLDAYV